MVDWWFTPTRSRPDPWVVRYGVRLILTYLPIGAAIPWWVRAYNITQCLLQLAAVVLTFLPASNAWFAAGQ